MPKSKTRPVEKDAITLLTADHKKVRPLLGELEETSARAVDKRGELLQTIELELKVHAKIEEEIFYPAFQKAAEKQDDKKLYYEALEEHHVVDTVMFPRARKLMSRGELVELHDRLAEAKTSLTESVLTKLVELVRPS